MSERLPPFTADILREVMNIGGAHATTALATMSHGRVMITVPAVALLKLEDILPFVGGGDDIRSMSIHPMTGDVRGFILFSYARHDARSLTERVAEHHGVNESGERAVTEALQEIGNILAGSCIRAIGDFLNIRFTQVVPGSASDMSGAILGSIVAEIGTRADDALITSLSFDEQQTKLGGRIFLLFDPDSTQRILHAAQKKIRPSS